jgi:hypothetical protein
MSKRVGQYRTGHNEAARAVSNDRRKQLANKKRQLREAERRQKLYDAVLRDSDRIDELSISEIATLHTNLKEVREHLVEEGTSAEEVDYVIALLNGLLEFRKTVNSLATEKMREMRIQTRRAIEQHMEEKHPPKEVMCVTCGQRPRHFGDYCKRCVPDNERPTGKV